MTWKLEDLLHDEGRYITILEYNELLSIYLAENGIGLAPPKSMSEAHRKKKVINDFDALLKRKNYKLHM